jgi:hemoglobin
LRLIFFKSASFAAMKADIKTRADIELLVNSFYDKVVLDDLLAPVFNEQARVDWKDHMPRMYDFWDTLLLGSNNYKGQPFPPHALLRIDKSHFDRWIQLFTQTLDEHFAGLTAEMAKQKARNIGAVFSVKLGITG